MQIRVTQPFAFRASLRDPVKTFDPGRHELTQAEAAHPFLQACIAAGRAELLAHPSAAAAQAASDGPQDRSAPADAQHAEAAAATSSDGTSGGTTSDGASDGAASGEEGGQAEGAGAGAAPPPRKCSARK